MVLLYGPISVFRVKFKVELFREIMYFCEKQTFTHCPVSKGKAYETIISNHDINKIYI